MIAMPPPGLPLFRTSFGEPGEARRMARNLDLSCDLIAEDLSPPAVLRLAAEDRLELGFEVRADISASPVIHTGRAALGEESGRLTSRISIPLTAFADASSRLLYMVFSYRELGRFDEWGYSGGWLVASLPRADLFEAYFSGFNLGRQ